MTRFKVARLLEVARTSGMVRITVVRAGSLELDLSEELRERFGLRHAVVVNTTRGNDAQTRDQVGEVAAELLSEITTADDVLGIGWARVVLAMAAKLRGLRADRIVQLTGALTRPDVEASSVEVVRSVAQRARAESSVFYAPMIVSDVETAQGLLRQEQVADAVARFDALSLAERDLMRRGGVHADLSGVLLDAHGDAVETPLSGRIIAITASQLRRIPEVIGIAYGVHKVSAAHAAIRGGYLHTLVTHTDFAQQLLRESR